MVLSPQFRAGPTSKSPLACQESNSHRHSTARPEKPVPLALLSTSSHLVLNCRSCRSYLRARNEPCSNPADKRGMRQSPHLWRSDCGPWTCYKRPFCCCVVVLSRLFQNYWGWTLLFNPSFFKLCSLFGPHLEISKRQGHLRQASGALKMDRE